MAKPKTTTRRAIRCYLCGHDFDVSSLTMSVPCPHCNKALKVEDVHVKTYVPVNDLQTCGKITIAKNGRVVAKMIRAGDGIDCEGTLEGAIEADEGVVLTDRASWKGKTLVSKKLVVEDGAKLHGHVKVPWRRPAPAPPPKIAKPASAAASPAAETEVKPGVASSNTNGESPQPNTPSTIEEPAMP